MKTYIDCIPCFYNQALRAARLAKVEEEKQKEVLDKVAQIMPTIDLETSPPMIAEKVYKVVKEITGVKDPFKEVKRESNEKAISVVKKLNKKVQNAKDPLEIATKLAIVGNIIDFGASVGEYDLEEEIEDILTQKMSIWDFEEFKELVKKAHKILYIGDNAGEIIFDKILIQRIINKAEVKYVVRGEPAINDILLEDAQFCGMDELCEVISSGSGVPGTPLKECKESFVKEFREADMVISKGQGNLETLISRDDDIFYMLKVKCKVMADKLGCKIGDIVLQLGR